MLEGGEKIRNEREVREALGFEGQISAKRIVKSGRRRKRFKKVTRLFEIEIMRRSMEKTYNCKNESPGC